MAEFQDLNFNLEADSCVPYENYKPAYLSDEFGSSHATPLVEGASLACVRPPPLTYRPLMNSKFYKADNTNSTFVSNAQMEAILYACQSFQNWFVGEKGQMYRRGFFLGDGCGVGKTRTIAGICHEIRLQKKRNIFWFAPSPMLINGAKAELAGFDDRINVKPLMECEDEFDGVAFCSYPALKASVSSRFCANTKLMSLLSEDFDGLFVFDECHYGKNASNPTKPSQAGELMIDLQQSYPKAHVLYSSATCGSESSHLCYMQRLELWGSGTNYKDYKSFAKQIGKLDVAGLELLAMDMKRRGVFVSRVLSFHNVQITVLTEAWPNHCVEIYERCCEIWIILFIHCCKNIDRLEPEHRRFRVSRFFSSALSFFQSLISSFKLNVVSRQIRQDLISNKSLIFGIQTTGESMFEDWHKKSFNKGRPYSIAAEILKGELAASAIYVGCPKVYFKGSDVARKVGNWNEEDEIAEMKEQELYGKSNFETEDYVDEDCSASGGKKKGVIYMDHVNALKDYSISEILRPYASMRDYEKEGTTLLGFPKYSVGSYGTVSLPSKLSWSANKAKETLSAANISRLYHELVPFLPINPLDELLERVRVAHSSNEDAVKLISNCTGRKYYYVFNQVTEKWEQRPTGERDTELKRYMEMNTRAVIVSNAASIGVSFHPRKDMANQQPRCHYTLQYPFSPDRLVQQLGRSLRAQQLHPPHYYLVKSEIPAEARFEAVIARRMEQQGAVCHGQSRSGLLSTTLSDAMCSSLAVRAINQSIDEILKEEPKLIPVFKLLGIKSGFLENLNCKKIINFTKLTFNRIMLCCIPMQKLICDKITRNIEDLIQGGISAYGPILEYPHPRFKFSATQIDTETYDIVDGPVFLQKFKISRVLKWEDLQENLTNRGNFYVGENSTLFYAEKIMDGETEGFKLYFPFSMDYFIKFWKDVPSSYKKIEKFVAKLKWKYSAKSLDEASKCFCSVIGTCPNPNCTKMLGCVFLTLLTGNPFKLTPYVSTYSEPFQIARVKYFKDGESHVDIGIVIHPSRINDIKSQLKYREVQKNGQLKKKSENSEVAFSEQCQEFDSSNESVIEPPPAKKTKI